jgi:ferredoxin-thioredoxin reductase catalytic subunit
MNNNGYNVEKVVQAKQLESIRKHQKSYGSEQCLCGTIFARTEFKRNLFRPIHLRSLDN